MGKISVSLLLAAILFAGIAGAEVADPAPPANIGTSLDGNLEESAPVVVWNRTIAVFRATDRGSTPADRARRAIARIEALPARGDHEIVTFNASTSDGTTGIMVGTKTGILFGLLPEDLPPSSKETLETTAQSVADRLKTVLDEHADQLQWPNLLRDLGISTAATLVYILFAWCVLRIKTLVIRKLDRAIAEWQRPLSIADINMVPILIWLERIIAKLFFLIVFFTATYIWLTFCFARFFVTQPWATRLGEYLFDFVEALALGIIETVPGIFTVIVIFWLTRIFAAGASSFFMGVEKKTLSVKWLQPDSARASRRIVIVIIWVFALTLAYPYIPGSGSDAFKGISVFLGLILSLGSSGFVNHLMSGLVIAYSGAISAGDYVSVGNIEGTVLELGPMSTKILTPTKQYTTVPNGVMISGHMTNYTRLAGREGVIMSTTVTIGYDAPWRQVHALLMSAAEQSEGIRKSPKPFVLQRALSDFYAEYELRFYMDRPAMRQIVLSALHAAIQDAFNEADVQIMSPNFVAQPDTPVLVPKSRWHTPPASPPGKQDGS